jgi:hypothetical protein
MKKTPSSPVACTLYNLQTAFLPHVQTSLLPYKIKLRFLPQNRSVIRSTYDYNKAFIYWTRLFNTQMVCLSVKANHLCHCPTVGWRKTDYAIEKKCRRFDFVTKTNLQFQTKIPNWTSQMFEYQRNVSYRRNFSHTRSIFFLVKNWP